MALLKEKIGTKLGGLETLRGLAAIYVLIHHARWFLWIGYTNGYLKQPDSFNFFNKVLVYFFSLFIYGHEAVIFFFILSGFVIHLKYSNNLKQNIGAFNFKQYLIRRIKRIYPPLLFALLFTFIIDSLGKYYGFPIYGGQTPFPIVKDNFTLTTLAGNLSFLMNTYVYPWGSDFALWSLKFEWWFYMLYPLFFLVTRKSMLAAFCLMLGLYFLSFQTSFWPNKLLLEIFSCMIIWWFGVILADLYTGRLNLNLKLFIPLLLVIPVLIFRGNKFDKQIQDVLWGLGFSGFLALVLQLIKQDRLPKIITRFKNLGSFSYTLYIIHIPILVFMSGYLLKHDKKLPLTFEFVFIGIFICLAFSWLVHFVVEKPFIRNKT
ncbi:MAG: acyltransferase [Bacteroidota bacterium]